MAKSTLYMIGEPHCWVGSVHHQTRKLLRWTGERRSAARFTREQGAAVLEVIRADLRAHSPEAAACAKRLRMYPTTGGHPAEV
ncbi:hypothetical protein [Botrimarina mediterranea]|uniref:Uncharacterized protein n=1 Tax=Botrimarina mediterranea TaxID=2528022 RepID=A0A518KC78_9BACT|nr:hypothetical protein [Botrimarina mediterranea]QDV75401.1 hypothetical protein Spa11_36180 [Botrimarina mediterranea]